MTACDMLSTAISGLIWFLACMRENSHAVSSHHSFNLCPHTKYLTSSEAVTFTIRSKTYQTAHGHTITLHTCHRRKLCSLNYHFSYTSSTPFSQKQGTPLTLQLLVPEDTTQVARSHDTSQYPQLMYGCSYFSSRG